MNFEECYKGTPAILMEGALGERLKREYGICFDADVAMADLVYSRSGREALENIWNEYISIADAFRVPFIAATPTRRANRERVLRSRYDGKIIEDNVRFLQKIRQSSGKPDMFVGGLMGCKGDAYRASDILAVNDACEFHSWQAGLFKEAGADFLFAGIMPSLPEAAGMAKAMERTELPYIISFMILRNGRLIDGTTIHDAIFQIDNSAARKPVCYMTNCVHPQVLYDALSYDCNKSSLVRERLCGLQPNTSPLSPEELDNSDELISTGAEELTEDIMKLKDFINLKIVGGCCGTDSTHIREIARRISDQSHNPDRPNNLNDR